MHIYRYEVQKWPVAFFKWNILTWHITHSVLWARTDTRSGKFVDLEWGRFFPRLNMSCFLEGRCCWVEQGRKCFKFQWHKSVDFFIQGKNLEKEMKLFLLKLAALRSHFVFPVPRSQLFRGSAPRSQFLGGLLPDPTNFGGLLPARFQILIPPLYMVTYMYPVFKISLSFRNENFSLCTNTNFDRPSDVPLSLNN